jgi:large subunit ribosomal protein L9
MQVILLKDIDTLGQAHEVVTVRPGYARNFLIPGKIAIEASGANLKVNEQRIKVKQKQEAKMLAAITEVINKLKESPVQLTAKTGTSGKIFGAVTSIQLARAVREQKGYEIDRKRFTILDEVKELGTYKASVNLGTEPVEIEFNVVGE